MDKFVDVGSSNYPRLNRSRTSIHRQFEIRFARLMSAGSKVCRFPIKFPKARDHAPLVARQVSRDESKRITLLKCLDCIFYRDLDSALISTACYGATLCWRRLASMQEPARWTPAVRNCAPETCSIGLDEIGQQLRVSRLV
jgi:hypothetical protein